MPPRKSANGCMLAMRQTRADYRSYFCGSNKVKVNQNLIGFQGSIFHNGKEQVVNMFLQHMQMGKSWGK